MGLAVVSARDAEFRGFRQDAFPGHGSHEYYKHKKKQRALGRHGMFLRLLSWRPRSGL